MTGPTNTGKTTGQRLFMMAYAAEIGGRFEGVQGLTEHHSGVASAEFVSVYTPEGRFRPIVRIEIGKNPTFGSLMADTIFCLTGRPAPAGNYFAKNMTILANQLLNQQIRLLIFDDVQHVVEGLPDSSRHKASDIFKVLAKALNAEIVLAGLPSQTNSVVRANSQAIPLALNRVHIGPIEFPYKKTDRFVVFLEELSEHMPFDTKCPIYELDLAQRLHHYSDGVWGILKNLLRAATVYAIENEYEVVDRSVLAKTVDSAMLPSDRGNPFLGAMPAPPPPRAEPAALRI